MLAPRRRVRRASPGRVFDGGDSRRRGTVHLRSFNLGRGAERVPADEVFEALCTRRLGHIGFPVVETVVSDDHGGLVEALCHVFPDARWRARRGRGPGRETPVTADG